MSAASASAAESQIKDLLGVHLALHFSRIADPVDNFSHVALLELAARIVAAHLIFIGFPRGLAVVDAQDLLNNIESLFRFLAVE